MQMLPHENIAGPLLFQFFHFSPNCLMNSVPYLSLAAWWKNAAQMHFRMTSQSVPTLNSVIFCDSMISFNWALTSRTLKLNLT